MSSTPRSGRNKAARLRPICVAALAAVLAGLAGCAGAPEQPSAAAPTLVGPAAAADARTRAAEARAKGDTDAALRLYIEAAEHDPEDADSLYAIGSIYDDRGGDGAALAARAYARAVQVDPSHARALEGLGLRYFADRQPEQARPLLSRAVGHDATLWRSHNALGLIADSRSDHDEAAAHYAAALIAHPGAAAILNNRGYSRYLAGSYDAAERDFRAALAADPAYDKALQNLGLVFARRGDYQTALATLTRVVGGHVAANDVGYIAMLKGDYPTAERMFQDAIRLSPRYYPTANENVAELRRRRASVSLALQ